MKKREINVLIEAVLSLIECEDANKEIVGALITDLYGTATDEYSLLLEALPHVADVASSDLATIIVTFYKMNTGIRNDPEFKAALKENVKAKAEMRVEIVQSYEKAGFSRPEAMAIMLQELANGKANLHSAAHNSNASGGNK